MGDGRTIKLKARVQIKKEEGTRRDEIQIGHFLPPLECFNIAFYGGGGVGSGRDVHGRLELYRVAVVVPPPPADFFKGCPPRMATITVK